MRLLLVAVLSLSAAAGLVASAGAGALPRPAIEAAGGVQLAQNRLLPNIFGGDEQKRRDQAETALRLDQLEQQVRSLTGQVEQLTFTVRRLEEALARGGAGGDQRSDAATAGPGAPPAPLGSRVAAPADAVPPAGGTGPIDLSALNRARTSAAPAGAEAPASGTAPAPAPAASAALDRVHDLQRSGRYAMAASAAREVLADNPTPAVASEARFLLGEALLAQGDYREAANQFLENYTGDPNGARAPISLLRLGTALNGLGEKEAACSSLEEFFGAYPNVSGELRAAAEEERRAADCV